MIDINLIRNAPNVIENSMKLRGLEINFPDIISLDKNKREIMTQIQALQSKNNIIAGQIGLSKAGKGNYNTEALIKESISNEDEIIRLKQDEDSINLQLDDLLANIPNILQEEVHFGRNEDDNIEIKQSGKKPHFAFQAKEHSNIAGHSLDLETAAKVSGSRFSFLYNDLAKLERRLRDFMIDIHVSEFGYTEVYVPHLVNKDSMFGTGQLPKFDNGYITTDGFYLIPTSEVPLTNIVRDKILNEEELPLRFTAYSQCFRSESGASGKDTHGMLRQHQFSKVELVSICKPEKSKDEHERMLSAAETVLKKLDLHYRVMLLSSGDTGFSSSKTYDIEVWLPGQSKYREISSCSNTLDFQARRMMARYKDKSGKKHYVHTLNGSGLAIGRTIIALIENYQTESGSYEFPDKIRDMLNL